jgi:hypothetical protein
MRAMVRLGGWPLLVSAALLCAWAGSAPAATLRLDAPEGCVDPTTLGQEVADLVGRPLADVPGADFHLAIAQRPGGRWHLQLEAREPGGATHVRELDATSCGELGDAAAVAIAVSVRALADAAPPPKPVAAAPGPAVAPPTVVAPAGSRPSPAPHWRPALALAVAADAGDLPGTGLNVMAGGALRGRALRLALMLGWVPSRDRATVPGGTFQLAFGAADGCFAPTWAAWTLMGCLGGELGAYWAKGINVARPDSRTAFWRAGRASLGAAVALSGSAALVLQGTAVVPWTRPAFVVTGSQSPVYRPDALALRIGAGLDFLF